MRLSLYRVTKNRMVSRVFRRTAQKPGAARPDGEVGPWYE
jgi:hypothetical protein